MASDAHSKTADEARRAFPGGRVHLPRLDGSGAPPSDQPRRVAFVGTAFDGEDREQDPPSAFERYFSTESLFQEPEIPPPRRVEEAPYKVLGLTSAATWEEVVATHRRLAKEWHPDRFVDADAPVRASAEDRTREINIAYEAIRRERRSADQNNGS